MQASEPVVFEDSIVPFNQKCFLILRFEDAYTGYGHAQVGGKSRVVPKALPAAKARRRTGEKHGGCPAIESDTLPTARELSKTC